MTQENEPNPETLAELLAREQARRGLTDRETTAEIGGSVKIIGVAVGAYRDFALKSKNTR